MYNGLKRLGAYAAAATIPFLGGCLGQGVDVPVIKPDNNKLASDALVAGNYPGVLEALGQDSKAGIGKKVEGSQSYVLTSGDNNTFTIVTDVPNGGLQEIKYYLANQTSGERRFHAVVAKESEGASFGQVEVSDAFKESVERSARAISTDQNAVPAYFVPPQSVVNTNIAALNRAFSYDTPDDKVKANMVADAANAALFSVGFKGPKYVAANFKVGPQDLSYADEEGTINFRYIDLISGIVKVEFKGGNKDGYKRAAATVAGFSGVLSVEGAVNTPQALSKIRVQPGNLRQYGSAFQPK